MHFACHWVLLRSETETNDQLFSRSEQLLLPQTCRIPFGKLPFPHKIKTKIRWHILHIDEREIKKRAACSFSRRCIKFYHRFRNIAIERNQVLSYASLLFHFARLNDGRLFTITNHRRMHASITWLTPFSGSKGCWILGQNLFLRVVFPEKNKTMWVKDTGKPQKESASKCCCSSIM